MTLEGVRRERRSGRWLAAALGVCALFLAQPSRADEQPTATGYLLSRLGDDGSVCGAGEAAWIWSYDGVLRRVTADGKVADEWSLPRIRSVYVTTDCTEAWVVPENGKDVDLVRAGSRQLVATDRSTLSDEVRVLAPLKDCAWIQTDSDLDFGTVSGGSIEWRSVYSKRMQDWSSMSCAGAWVAPTDEDPGILAFDRNEHRVAALDKQDITTTQPWANWSLVWASPDEGPGVWAIDREGHVLNGGKPFLAHDPVIRIVTSGEKYFTWIQAGEHERHLYGFAWDRDSPDHVRALHGGQPIADPSTGSLIQPDIMITVGDGSHVWVTPRERNLGGMPRRIWSIRAGPGDEVAVETVDPAEFEGKRIALVFWTTGRDDVLVKTLDQAIYQLGHASKSEPNALRLSLNVDNLTPSTVAGTYWLKSGSRYLLSRASSATLPVARVEIGNQTLGYGDAHETEAPKLSPRGLATARVLLAWHGPTAQPEGRIEVTLRDGDRVVASGAHELVAAPPDVQSELAARGCGKDPCLVAYAAVDLNRVGELSDDVSVAVKYTNEAGMDLDLTWPHVHVTRSFYERLAAWPGTRAIVALVIPLFLVVLAFRNSPRVLRWVPSAIPLLEIVLTAAFPRLADLQPRDLALTFLALAGFSIGLAFFWPALFRHLANVQPFRAAAPLALRVAWVRRHLFRDHMKALSLRLGEARRQANNERFYEIPLEVKVARSTIKGVKATVAVGDVLGVLLERSLEKRGHVLIEGHGGRGKSALLNELLSRAIDACNNDARSPIPVLVDGRKDKTREAIEAGLGRFALARDLTDVLLRSGDFVVFLDGLSESAIPAAEIESFLDSELGAHAALCATFRPSEFGRLPVPVDVPRIVLEPRPLDDHTARAFVRHYLKADRKRGHASNIDVDQLMSVLEHVARATDGSYLPVVVRLAVLGAPANASRIADVYQAALEQLLTPTALASKRGPPDLMAEAAKLAADTYWPRGERAFAYARSSREETALVGELKKAGVVVDANVARSVGVARVPREVRFFHDSVQSYLAAVFLAGQSDWEATLARAAGDEAFEKSRAQSGSGSELFQMCLQTFVPRERLRGELRTALARYAEKHSRDLALADVIAALPQDVTPTALSTASGGAEDVRSNLEAAIPLCDRADVEAAIEALGTLFAGLAPRLRSVLKKDYERRVAS